MDGAGAPSLQVPDGINIFSAQYARDGDDLVIAAEGGPPLTVTDYFAGGTPAALEAPNGALLRGDVVELLAGPRAPAQYAQADAPEGAVAIGQVETLSGSSTATRASGETVELGMGDPVFEGDVVETGADSTLGIRLEDGTLASMSANSRLVLNEFVFEAGGSDNWMLVDLVEGAFAFLTGAIAPSGGMEITTPVAVMAIRGTMPVAFVAGEDGASQFFAASDQSYELLHAATRELLTVITSAAGFSLSSPDAPIETIELDAETLGEIDGLLEVLNQTAAEADLLGIQTGSGFHTYSGFGSIDGNLAALIDFLLLLDGALSEEAVVEVEDSSQFLMAEAALVAQPDQAATEEMDSVTVDVLDNDSHPEGDDLTVIFADVPDGQGTVEISPDGQQLTYHPGNEFDYLALGETADVVITYVVADSTGATASTTVTVTLTGINQAPDIAAVADTNIDEQTDTQPLQTTVTVAFTDVDLNNVGHAATVVGVAVEGDTGKLNPDDLEGLLTPGTVTKNAGENTGSAEFDFSAASTVFDPLSPEESVTLTYTVEIDDQDGGTSQQTFDIVVTGTNDAPVIDVTESTVAATVVEEGSDADGDPMGQPSASGQIEASDVDNGGTTFSVAPTPGSYGVLTIDASGAWTYVLNEGAADPLALGESDTDVFTVTVTDGFEATDEVEVTITVTGANDAPVIHAETTSASATVNETENKTGSTHVHEVGGIIAFGDVDVSDTHGATVTADGSEYVGTLELGEVDQDGKTVGWTFSVVDSEIDHLPKGVKLTQTYTVTISDGRGGAVEQMVTVTMIGANDAPTIIVGDGDSASADLDETDEGLTAEGTLTVSDVSVSDVVTATVTGVVTSGDHSTEIGTSTLSDYLTVEAPETRDADGKGTLTWKFDSLEEAFDFLAVEEELVLTYTVEVSDGTDTSSFPVTITINGTNDKPVVTGETLTGSVTEALGTPAPDVTLSDGGLITFTDLDLSDGHSVTATPQGTTLGTLSAAVTESATGGETGEITWTYEVDAALVEYLADGESLTEVFDITLSDGNDETITRTVTVTVNGTNDAPVITGEAVTGSVAETVGTPDPDTVLGDSGTISFTDVDLSDGHTVTASPQGSTLGTLSAAVTETATGGETGEITWTYEVDAALVEYLADGESLEEVFEVTLSDGKGGSLIRTVTVTVKGTDDAPVISVETGDSAAGDIFEITGRTGSTFQHALDGTLTFTDVDVSDDGHGVVAEFANASGTVSGLMLTAEELESLFSATIAQQTGSDGTVGQIDWQFAADDAAFDYLDVGETLVLTYTVTVTHENGESSEQEVTITVHGADEGPIFDFVVTGFSGGNSEFENVHVGTLGDEEVFLLLTPKGGSTINSSANDVGIGAKKRDISAGEGINIDLVTDAGSDQDGPSYRAHLMAIAFSFTIASVDGNAATVFVRAVNADDDNNFDTDTDPGDILVDIGLIRVTDANGNSYEIQQADFVIVDGYIVVDGLQDGDTLTILGGEEFNRVEILNGADETVPGTTDTYDGGSFVLSGMGADVEQVISGTAGNDYLVGTDGDDYISGKDGDDVLIGLGGLDTLEGGAGNDLFVLTDLSIHDVIVDYGDGDVIDLTQLGFELAAGEFTADAAGEFVQYDPSTGELKVDVDGDGDAADFELAAVLSTPPSDIVVRLTDGSTSEDVVV